MVLTEGVNGPLDTRQYEVHTVVHGLFRSPKDLRCHLRRTQCLVTCSQALRPTLKFEDLRGNAFPGIPVFRHILLTLGEVEEQFGVIVEKAVLGSEEPVVDDEVHVIPVQGVEELNPRHNPLL